MGPSEQLKVDNTAKANDKTETKIGKKRAAMEMQGEETEPKEIKKDDSDVDIKLVVQQKENVNKDQKPSEQLKVENKAKENDKTETKSGKKEAPTERQGKVNEPNEINNQKD